MKLSDLVLGTIIAIMLAFLWLFLLFSNSVCGQESPRSKQFVQGDTLRIFWQPNTEADLEGYILTAAWNDSTGIYTTQDTTLLHVPVTTTVYSVQAYDTDGNISEKSEDVIAYLMEGFKEVYNVSELSVYMSESGTYDIPAQRLGFWDGIYCEFDALVEKTGIWQIGVYCSGKINGSKLFVNDQTIHNINTGPAYIRHIELPLYKGVNTFNISAQGAVFLWQDAITFKWISKITDTEPPEKVQYLDLEIVN